jgi:hypothetical protein
VAAQLDIFAAAAEDDAIPDTTWPAFYGPWQRWGDVWDESNGPHYSWEAFRECWTDQEDVEVYKDKKRFRALVCILRDSSTNLWVGNYHVDHPTGGGGGPWSYSPAAYRTREACIAAWKVRAMEVLAEYRKQHEEERQRDEENRKRWDGERRARLAALPMPDDDETGEEGMAERYAAALDDGDLDDEDEA